MKQCSKIGCGKLVRIGKCEKHREEKTKYPRGYDDRESASARGYGYRWRKSRYSYLIRNPLCVHCLAHSMTTAATDIDHIKPHGGDQVLFWDVSNWQSLCHSCHSKKTRRENC